MRMLVIASITVGTVLGLSAQAHQNQSQDPSQTTENTQSTQPGTKDTHFIRKAAEGNLAEVDLGKLGAEKSQNSQIQQFSKSLQTDHQSANQKLQSIAQQQGVQMPQTLDSKHQREVSRLQKLSGNQFDKEFAVTALREHAKTLALFQKEAQQGQDQATKQYAQGMVPALQHHLDMAKEVAKSVGVSETTISSILSRYPEAVGGATSPGGHQHGTEQKQGSY